MRHASGRLIYSASDLNDFLACEHLSALERACALGEIVLEPGGDAGSDLARQKGMDHERAYLARLEAEGRQICTLTPDWTDPAGTEAATLAAMQAGWEVIYQAGFCEPTWRGASDFLIRVDGASALGDWHYEVLDTKLARDAKPYFIVQLCFYSEHVARLQGRAPGAMHVVLGTNEQRSFRVDDFAAYYRRVKHRFLAAMATPGETQPLPNAHCEMCPWQARCDAEWEAIDHLSRVANIRRSQIVALEAAGIRTLEALGTAGSADRPPGMARGTFATLANQAALQLRHRHEGVHSYELLPAEAGRGLDLLPTPDPGDVFFDMEGDPFVDGGLEYLFGAHYFEDGAWRFRPFWAHDRAEERAAFEAFVDFVAARRDRYPGLHVYHYAAYEETALKRLAMQHGTREERVDEFLRAGVLVDLFRVVRQGLRASTPSYSIKKLETFYMEARAAEVKSAVGSIESYEAWLETGEATLLEEIRHYNEEDCVSTRLLRDWLLGLRGDAPPPAPIEVEPSEGADAAAAAAELEALVATLMAGVPEPPLTAEDRARRTLADLLGYHRREAKPAWWAFFERCAMDDEEHLDDGETLAGLVPEGEGPVRPQGRSQVWRLKFPPQEHRVRVGVEVRDPATGKGAGEVVAIGDDWIELKIGSQPLPRAIFPHTLLQTKAQQAALRRLAETVLAGADHFPAAWDLLLGMGPRIDGLLRDTPLYADSPTVERVSALAGGLLGSTLVVQGPPGAGKTFMGARVIVDLMQRGHRIGIAATSHKAIHNLLAEVEAVATERGFRFQGVKKCGKGEESRFTSTHGMITNVDSNKLDPTAFQLLAGTSWFFAPDAMDGVLDYLVLDEAGQISLADALAMSTSARNLLLLGDPQQLPQVTQGVHPNGSGRSVLEYVLAGKDTVPSERGVFLDQTWRMHPAIAGYISSLAYEGRLQAAARCSLQRIEAPGFATAGLHLMPVAHAGNAVASAEEATTIAALFDRLIGATFCGPDGVPRPLVAADILVVSPYNRQVELLRETLPPDARVGTVDKFQGQEAPVVMFSMAASDGEELPRGLEFLFDRNRLNVAISRAKCLAFVVASPRLLDIVCRSVDQMRLVNALCDFAERAAPLDQPVLA